MDLFGHPRYLGLYNNYDHNNVQKKDHNLDNQSMSSNVAEQPEAPPGPRSSR